MSQASKCKIARAFLSKTIALFGILLGINLTGCNHDSSVEISQVHPPAGDVESVKLPDPVLQLSMEGDYQGIHIQDSCKLASWRHYSSGGINEDNGAVALKETVRLVSMETNGFQVLFERAEAVNGVIITNHFGCFFPFGAITTTQAFGSTQIRGQFK